ncbi:MAG TPA: 2-oxoacid:acceptor oxidoreductase subunit alpha [Firmicutes bacterium]|nr:2-oxoacid:acceptor oxidoreductase subunit alpha [Bacillota bacterium]
MSPTVKLLQGNEACVEGALAAGVKFFAGYPITPSTEIAELLAERLPLVGGRFMQMEDEIASMAAVIGASLTGTKAMTATSGPGFSLKQENLGFAIFTEIPCVVVNVMRGGPSTGLPTSPAQGDVMQARWGTHGDHPVIAVYPASVPEAYELTIKAFNLSEKYRTPVILLMDEVVGHMREKVELPDVPQIPIEERPRPTVSKENYLPYDNNQGDVPPLANFGDGYHFHVTGLTHDQTGFPTSAPAKAKVLYERLHRKIENNLDDILMWETKDMEDAEIGVLAYGSTARSAARAVSLAREQGIKAGLMRPITIWPFPEKLITQYASQLKSLVVAEMNLGQYVNEVERAAQGQVPIKRVLQANGELIRPDTILQAIMEVK